MAAFHPGLDELPQEFAVFPLSGALLLPRGKLPLNIFEERYLAMTLDSLAAGRMFGMVQPDAHAQANGDESALYRVGCLGRVSSYSETDDGRLLITLSGIIRFDITAELEMRHGYRRVRGDFSRFEADMATPPPAVALDREKIMTALRGYFQHRQVQANWDAIKALSDDALVITLAMACPFEAVEKQAVLEAPNDTDRADVLIALLQMGAASPDPPPGHSVS
jgi:Lon protease-like protein